MAYPYGPTNGTDTGRNLSANLWKSFPREEVERGERPGFFFWDDFLNAPFLVSSSNTKRWAALVENGEIAQGTGTGVPSGGVWFLLSGADNNSTAITLGGNTGAVGKISYSDPKLLCFEFRYTAAPTGLTMAAGLGQEGLAADNALIPDGGATFTAKDFVGFRVLAGDTDGLDATHALAGGAEVVVKEVVDTLVVGQYVKAGLCYDPISRLVSWYKNGAFQGSVPANATNFPDGEELVPIFLIKSIGATLPLLGLDWVAFGQLE